VDIPISIDPAREATPRGPLSISPLECRLWPKAEAPVGRKGRRPDLHRAFRLISAVGSWSEPARYVGEPFGNVAGRLLSVLCPWRGRLSHDVRLRCGGIWQRSRDVQLLYCALLEPLCFSG
jgi:hypothetical protein